MAQPVFIANPTPLDEKQIAEALAQEIIGPELALEEVRVFNETRVPEMPRVRTAAEWQTKAAEYAQKRFGQSHLSRQRRPSGATHRSRWNGATPSKTSPAIASRN